MLDAKERRARVAELFGEATIEAAFAERHLIANLPSSIWRQLLFTAEKLARLGWAERIEGCAHESELIRRLLVLLELDSRATAKVIRSMLGK